MTSPTICPTCKGSYLATQPDGNAYVHGCPPLSEWEKKAWGVDITITVERTPGVRDQLQAAIAAKGVINATG